MTEAQETAIRRHGKQLLAIFPNCTEQDPVKLCKKLRRLENVGHRLAEDWCNGPVPDYEEQSCVLMAKLAKVLGKHDAPVFLNGDPRGYALKIEDEWMQDNGPDYSAGGKGEGLRLYQDWGGYGILAPEIGKDGR